MTKLLVIGIEPVKKIHPCYAEFTYTPRSLPDDTTPMVRRDRTDRSQTRGVYQVCETHGELCGFFSLQCVLSMFEDMGFINTYKIDMHTLARSDNTLNVTSCDHQGVGVLQFRPWSCAVCYCRLHYSSFFCCCSVSTIQHAHLKTLKELDISSSKAATPLRIFFHSQIQ